MQPDGEEELHVGGRRVPDRLRRPGMVVVVAVAGLAAAFLTTRLGGDDSTTAASSAPARSSAASPTSASVTVSSVAPEPFPPTSIPACPIGRLCRTETDVPAPVVSALRDRYPGARVTEASTLTASKGDATTLLRRSIAVVAGSRKLTVVVTPFVLGPDSFDRETVDQVSQVSVESTGSGKTVSILLFEPIVARPNDLIVLRLARDPRLGALA